MALRIGAAKFIIPFAFAYYPTLLLVENFDPLILASIMLRLTLTIYLISSALSAYDRAPLNYASITIRLILAGSCLLTPIAIHGPATLLTIIIILRTWQIYPFKNQE
jgi:TRAP-type uncharacterized transport system fused permease subunit